MSPAAATGHMGDRWTIRELQTFSSSDCSGKQLSTSKPKASVNPGKVGKAFDNSESTYWQGNSVSLAKFGEWISFHSDSAVGCIKVRQCDGTGCAPKLQLEFQADGASTWRVIEDSKTHGGKGKWTFFDNVASSCRSNSGSPNLCLPRSPSVRRPRFYPSGLSLLPSSLPLLLGPLCTP